MGKQPEPKTCPVVTEAELASLLEEAENVTYTFYDIQSIVKDCGSRLESDEATSDQVYAMGKMLTMLAKYIEAELKSSNLEVGLRKPFDMLRDLGLVIDGEQTTTGPDPCRQEAARP